MSGAFARATSLPPPVGGLDNLSALADMPANHAVLLDNWFPRPASCVTRRGYQPHVTGFAAQVESLLVYSAPSGTQRLFAAAGTSIFNATTAGPVGGAVVSGLANARFDSVQITNAANVGFLLAYNGADTPRVFDGSTWSNTTITGPTVTAIVWANVHQRRLWVGEIGTLRGWYLDPNAIGGAAAAFDFTNLVRRGGSIISMGTWTRDSGDGQDDLAVFLTDQGEVLVYAGTDPATPGAWALQGLYTIAKPLGRRAMIRYGASLAVLTEEGIVSLAEVISLDRVQQGVASLSRLVNPTISALARDNAGLFGWQAMFYPAENMALFNAPDGPSNFVQFAFNTLTGAVGRFTGVPARCWALLNGRPYFGGATDVFAFDVGASDNGADIVATAAQAFNGFGNLAQKKRFRQVQPILRAIAPPSAAVDVALDYDLSAPMPAVQPLAAGGGVALWDVALWDVALWPGEATYAPWFGVRGVARSASVRLRVSSRTVRTEWIGTNVLAVAGGTL